MSCRQSTLLVDRAEGDGRWFVYRDKQRIGMVIGGNRTYCAETVRGKHLGTATTVMGAAKLVNQSGSA